MKNLFGFIPVKYRPLAIPTVVSLGIIILAIFGIPTLINNIKTSSSLLNQEKKKENIYREKLTLLQEVSQDQALNLTDEITLAVPQENSVLFSFAQLRKMSQEMGVNVENLRMGSSQGAIDSGAQASKFTFEVAGPLPAVISLLKQIPGIAPISKIERVKLSVSLDLARAEIAIASYWSPVPKTIPSIDSPVVGLTDNDQEIIRKLSSLIPPPFTVAPTATSAGRSNPFSF